MAQSSRSETNEGMSKSGKNAAITEVRGFRISLSTDSQGGDLPLIPPGSDGSSTQKEVSVQKLSSTQDKMYTLPQGQPAEEDWNKVGPEFQQAY